MTTPAPIPTPQELLDVCVAAARAGGAVLVDGLRTERRVEMNEFEIHTLKRTEILIFRR